MVRKCSLYWYILTVQPVSTCSYGHVTEHFKQTSVNPPESSALCRCCVCLGSNHKAVRESGQPALRGELCQPTMISLPWGLIWCCSSHWSQHQRGHGIAATSSRAAFLYTANQLPSLECWCLSDWDTKSTGTSVQMKTGRTMYLMWLNRAMRLWD